MRKQIMRRRSSFVVLPLALLALPSILCCTESWATDTPTLENYSIKVLRQEGFRQATEKEVSDERRKLEREQQEAREQQAYFSSHPEKWHCTLGYQPLGATTVSYQLATHEQNRIVAIVKIDLGSATHTPPPGIPGVVFRDGDNGREYPHLNRCTLNPEGWGEYGPIPPVTQLSMSDADRLWGPAKERTIENEKTYELEVASSLIVGQGHLPFELDLVFNNNNLLERYRVRNVSEAWTSAWTLVDQNKGGEHTPP